LKIALTTKGKTLESKVSKYFKSCAYLLIVETDDLSIVVFPNNNDNPNTALELAGIIIDQDCEAVITGEIEKTPLNVLADACVSRYSGVNYTVKDALRLLEEQKLAIIRGEL
jgi:predicted Fe-Mo cluster-binding NifX family protein